MKKVITSRCWLRLAFIGGMALIHLAGCAGKLQMKHLDTFYEKYQKGDRKQCLKLAQRFETLPEDFRIPALEIFRQMADTSVIPYFEKWVTMFDANTAETIVTIAASIGKQKAIPVVRKYLEATRISRDPVALAAYITICRQSSSDLCRDLGSEFGRGQSLIVSAFVTVGVPAIPALSNAYAESPNPAKREAIFKILKNIGQGAYPSLIEMLSRPQKFSLGEGVLISQGSDAVPILLDSLNEIDHDHDERICNIISKIGPSAVPELKKGLNMPKLSVDRRLKIATTLSEIKGSAATDALLSGSQSQDVVLTVYCLNYLSGRADASHSTTLFDLMVHHPRDDVKAICQRLLIEIGSSTEPLVLNALKDSSSYIRNLAYSILNQIGSGKSLEIYRQSLSDSEPVIRLQAVDRLSWALGDDGMRAVLRLMEDPDAGVRNSVFAVVKRFPELAFPLLDSLLRSEHLSDPQLQSDYRIGVLVGALGFTGKVEALSAIFTNWPKYGPISRNSAIWATILLSQSASGSQVLVDQLRSGGEPELICGILSSMCVTKQKPAPVIRDLIAHKNPNVRSHAARYVLQVADAGFSSAIAAQLSIETYYPALLFQLMALAVIGDGLAAKAVAPVMISFDDKLGETAVAAFDSILARNGKSSISDTSLQFRAAYSVKCGDFETADSLYLIMIELNSGNKSYPEERRLVRSQADLKRLRSYGLQGDFGRLWERYWRLVSPDIVYPRLSTVGDAAAADDSDFALVQPLPGLTKPPKSLLLDGFDVSLREKNCVKKVSSGEIICESSDSLLVIDIELRNISSTDRWLNTDLIFAVTETGFLPINPEALRVKSLGHTATEKDDKIRPGGMSVRRQIYSVRKGVDVEQILILSSDCNLISPSLLGIN